MDEPGWAFLVEALARLRGRAVWVRPGPGLGDQPPVPLDPPPAPRPA
jgi:hypothetical protein